MSESLTAKQLEQVKSLVVSPVSEALNTATERLAADLERHHTENREALERQHKDLVATIKACSVGRCAEIGALDKRVGAIEETLRSQKSFRKMVAVVYAGIGLVALTVWKYAETKIAKALGWTP